MAWHDYRGHVPQPAPQPEPNHDWRVGCSPDNCSSCGIFYEIKKQRDELMEVMLTAAETFASYAEIHAAKTPPDIVKAEFNRDRAQMCFAAIASVKEV